MITPETLFFIITNFCKHKDASFPKETKIACMEYIVNCAIGYNGQIPEKVVNKCREDWASQEVKERLEK